MIVQLPSDIESADKNTLEKMGLIFLDKVSKGGGILQEAQLPDGWTRQVVNQYWSSFLDEKNRVRFQMFLKLEPWDTRTHIVIKRRFFVFAEEVTPRPQQDYNYIGVVKDSSSSDKTIHTTEVCQDFFGKSAENKAKEWLNLNYPDWQNPLAYWG